MKRIVLCADDYGQAPTISTGILTLVNCKRLTAVSCMVNTPYWPEAATNLLPYRESIDIGLHFNLTYGEPLSERCRNTFGASFPSLSMLLRKAYSISLDQADIAAELNAQIDLFQKTLGFLPQFIDGHQHVHHFPVIRKALVDVYNARLKLAKPYIRLVDMRLKPSDLATKKIIIYMTGVQRLKQLLDVHDIPYNRSFSGIYSFQKAQKFPAIFRSFLQDVDNNGLIMCHPGGPPNGEGDVIAEARFLEYQYLMGKQFEEDCIDQSVILRRFS